MDNNVKMKGIFKRIRNNQETLKTRKKIFRDACIAGDENLVRLLLQIVDEVPEYSLDYAVESGNITSVEFLLEAGVDVGHNALIKAVKKGDVEIAKLLIEAGANVNGTSGKGEPLRIAVVNNDIKMAELLLEKGADVQICNNYPLRIAVIMNNVDMMELLLKYGANIHVNADFPLRYAIENGYEQTVKVLLEHGANVHGKINSQLRKAAIKGSREIVKVLLEYGARLGDAYKYELSFLNKLNAEIAKILLEGGYFDNNPVPFEEYESLIERRERLRMQGVKMLISPFEDGSENHEQRLEKEARFKYAVEKAIYKRQRSENMKLIKQILPTINEIREESILLATESEDIELLEILLNNGGNIHVKDDYLLSLAFEDRNMGIMEILIGNGGNLNKLDEEEGDLFTRAVYEGNIEMAEILLEKIYIRKHTPYWLP